LTFKVISDILSNHESYLHFEPNIHSPAFGICTFFFNIYQPIKVHRICADSSAKEVLKSNSKDAFDMYQSLYKDCSSEKSLSLATIFLPKQ